MGNLYRTRPIATTFLQLYVLNLEAGRKQTNERTDRWWTGCRNSLIFVIISLNCTFTVLEL